MMRRFDQLLLISLFCAATTTVVAAPLPKPSLVVVISVDQFGANLYDQWRSHYKFGMKTLGDGLVYANGYQAHAATETCPGHATLLTGRNPAANGIVANTWYDAAQGKDVYCSYADGFAVAGLPKAEPRGPVNLLSPTLGDWLKQQSADNRVFAIAGKDRAAIMMAGHHADGVFWYVDGFGFTTYVAPGENEQAKLDAVRTYNADLHSNWNAALPKWAYIDKHCTALEQNYAINSFNFQSRVPPVGPQPETGAPFDTVDGTKPFYRSTPLLDKITLDGARMLIKSQHLGHGKGIDVLAVGLSATDYIGHRFGSQGPEMCDQQVRLDFILGQFLSELTALQVPMIVVLTADHGGSDFVERSAQRSFPSATRISPGNILGALNEQLRSELKLPFYDPLVSADAGRDIQQLHIIDEHGKADVGPRRQSVLGAAMRLIAKDPRVAAVYSRDQARAAMPKAALPADEMSVLERFAVNADQSRSGDIFVAYQPFSYLGIPDKPGDTLAGHGSPYNYDRRVPIIFWWPGVVAQERPLPVKTIDIAPTLSHILGFVPPTQVDGRCLDLDDFGVGRCQ